MKLKLTLDFDIDIEKNTLKISGDHDYEYDFDDCVGPQTLRLQAVVSHAIEKQITPEIEATIKLSDPELHEKLFYHTPYYMDQYGRELELATKCREKALLENNTNKTS